MMMALNAPKAAFGITDVLDDPSAMGAKNAIAAAKEVLDRTGLVKKEKVEVETKRGGMFILPPKTMGEWVCVFLAAARSPHIDFGQMCGLLR